MSTDWIKMRVDLRTHPKVVRMSSALRADKLRVIGGLFSVWSIFDAHAADGVLDGYTPRALDDELGWRGFSAAMSDIGWLLDLDGVGLEAPRFDEHNGQSAKRRAMETERKRLEREAEKAAADAQKSATVVGQPSASNADKSVTREEKRREEKKEEKDPPAARVPPATKGCRLPKDWSPGPEGEADAVSAGLLNGRIAVEAAKFRDYWVAQPGQKGVKLDWSATWRNWCRRAAGDTPKQGASLDFEGMR